MGLLYKKSSSGDVVGFSDADWGGDNEDFKSTSGYCFNVGGTMVSCKSKHAWPYQWLNQNMLLFPVLHRKLCG